MSRQLVLAPSAREDLLWWRRTNPRVATRIRRLLEAILADPLHGIGKPERLRALPDTWSRRITGEHRLVYRVFGDRIEVIAARFHYERRS